MSIMDAELQEQMRRAAEVNVTTDSRKPDDAAWNAALEAAAKTHDDAVDRARKWLDENEARLDTLTIARVSSMRVRLETHRASAVAIRALKREAT